MQVEVFNKAKNSDEIGTLPLTHDVNRDLALIKTNRLETVW